MLLGEPLVLGSQACLNFLEARSVQPSLISMLIVVLVGDSVVANSVTNGLIAQDSLVLGQG